MPCVADNNGFDDLPMHPSTVDFVDVFRRIEAKGFIGHYMCGFDQMLAGRDYLVERAGTAGIAIL
jgi:hypothetical protein